MPMAPAAIPAEVASDSDGFSGEANITDPSTQGGNGTTKPLEPPKTNGVAGDKAGKEGEKVNETSDSDSEKSSTDAKDETPADQSMKCEIKHLDRRYDEKQQKYFAEPKEEVEKPAQEDWWRLYAFCIVKHYDKWGGLEGGACLYVNHQPLRQLLHDVIGYYPSDPIDVDDVQIEAPYHALFHYRQQLRDESLKRFETDEDSLAQAKLLLSWIDENFELDIAAYEKCVTRGLKAVAYDHLWILFPPGTIVYMEVLGQQRAFRAYDYFYEEDDEEHAGLVLFVEFIDFDGEELGVRKTEFNISKYNGTRDVRELPVMPFSLLDDEAEMREALLERGRKFESYVGQKYTNYSGIAVKKEAMGYSRFHVSGRVMVDCKTFHRFEPNDSFRTKPLLDDDGAKLQRTRKKASTPNFASTTKTFAKLSDENAMITNATVRGYSFGLKRFLEFFVDQLFPIEWNSRCFEDLVIDDGVKKMVQALVTTHVKKRSSFDDIVKGKGQGLVCVLHGPPGVGKTLTAECVAEYVQRPLYMVSSGDLGVSSSELDSHLTRIMDMTSTWGAVLLIDEADVFLEQRSLRDLHRNAMVSVCLRILEYHTGILFLTTNRVTTFDDAFKSRIHIPIRYTDLSVESRKQIWRNFCGKIASSPEGAGAGVDIDEAGLEALAQHDLNGRQIKNIVKTAESLAIYDGVRLDLEQLQQVTKIQALFEKDLSSLSGVDYTAPGASRKDADSRSMFM